MALTSWSTSNYLSKASAVISAYPFAIDGWGYMTALADFALAFYAGNSSVSPNDAYRGQVYIESGNHVNAEARADPGGSVLAQTSTTISANTWFYWTGSFVSTTLREAYLNAGGRGADTASLDPAASDRCKIANNASLDFPWQNGGALGEIAVWNLGSMNQTEREALWSKRFNGGSGGNGANPLAINAEVGQPHTGALVAYWRLSNTSDLTDLSLNGHDLSMVGTLTNWGGTAVPVDPVPGGAPIGDGFMMYSQWG